MTARVKRVGGGGMEAYLRFPMPTSGYIDFFIGHLAFLQGHSSHLNTCSVAVHSCNCITLFIFKYKFSNGVHFCYDFYCFIFRVKNIIMPNIAHTTLLLTIQLLYSKSPVFQLRKVKLYICMEPHASFVFAPGKRVAA